jgi:hypothetical protein
VPVPDMDQADEKASAEEDEEADDEDDGDDQGAESTGETVDERTMEVLSGFGLLDKKIKVFVTHFGFELSWSPILCAYITRAARRACSHFRQDEQSSYTCAGSCFDHRQSSQVERKSWSSSRVQLLGVLQICRSTACARGMCVYVCVHPDYAHGQSRFVLISFFLC